MAALFEGLVAEDPRDLTPVPGVASHWEVSADGRCYTFHLRADARWSNGDPVTAGDFAYSYRRMLSPGLAAEYAYMLFPLVGAKAFNEGRTKDFATVGVTVPEAATLVLTLERPVPYFLQLLNHYSWWPVHPQTIETHGPMDQRDTPWTRPGNLVGNGPFVLTKWEVNREIAVQRNPLYWDAATVRLDGIRFLPIDSAETEERAFREGKLHLTSTIPLHQIDLYRRRSPDLIRFDPYLGTYFYRFNTQVKPLDDPRVRQALAMTIQRSQITEFVLKGGQLPALHFTPPNTGGYTAEARLTEDPAQARELLARAGYPNGEGMPSLELLYNTSEQHRVLAEAVQQMWKTALGVDVRLVNQEWKVYLDTVRRGDYQIARAAWIGDYNDPNTFLDMWVSDGGNNRTGWSNPQYDALLNRAAAEGDGPARLDLFQQAEAILMREVPIAPVYFYVRSLLIRPNVRGWHPTLLDHHPYKHVYMDAEQTPGE
ncbi:MAG: peptide ABC transporter substrate-binding protein [Lentisphaeria bacterium]|nr:peptide ABC transporter substrate-binding protein [Lentisphaeria bacterium]